MSSSTSSQTPLSGQIKKEHRTFSLSIPPMMNVIHFQYDQDFSGSNPRCKLTVKEGEASWMGYPLLPQATYLIPIHHFYLLVQGGKKPVVLTLETSETFTYQMMYNPSFHYSRAYLDQIYHTLKQTHQLSNTKVFIFMEHYILPRTLMTLLSRKIDQSEHVDTGFIDVLADPTSSSSSPTIHWLDLTGRLGLYYFSSYHKVEIHRGLEKLPSHLVQLNPEELVENNHHVKYSLEYQLPLHTEFILRSHIGIQNYSSQVTHELKDLLSSSRLPSYLFITCNPETWPSLKPVFKDFKMDVEVIERTREKEAILDPIMEDRHGLFSTHIKAAHDFYFIQSQSQTQYRMSPSVRLKFADYKWIDQQYFTNKIQYLTQDTYIKPQRLWLLYEGDCINQSTKKPIGLGVMKTNSSKNSSTEEIDMEIGFDSSILTSSTSSSFTWVRTLAVYRREWS